MYIRKKTTKKRLNASITLTTVIILSAMLILAGIALVYTVVDFSRSTKNYENAYRAEINTFTCFEETLRRLSQDKLFLGSFTVVDNGNSCTATVENDSLDPNIKLVELVSSTDQNIVRKNHIVDVSGITPVIVE